MSCFLDFFVEVTCYLFDISPCQSRAKEISLESGLETLFELVFVLLLVLVLIYLRCYPTFNELIVGSLQT